MTNRGFILGVIVSLLVKGRGKAPVGSQFTNSFQQLFRVPEAYRIPEEGNGNEGGEESTFAIILDLILNDPCGSAPWPRRPNDDNGRRLPRGILRIAVEAGRTDPIRVRYHAGAFVHFDRPLFFLHVSACLTS